MQDKTEKTMPEVLTPISQEVDLSEEKLDRLNKLFEYSDPGTILEWGAETFGEDIVLGTGFGPSGVFMIHKLYERDLDVNVFFLDTSLLFDSTYELRANIEQEYDINITKVSTDLTVEEQAEKYGDELWKRNPNRCCYLRKVVPLRNYLIDKKAWVSGVRRSQSDTRKQAKIIEWDPENEVVKINPLARWTGEEVWQYIHENELSYNPLHDEGYPSIGCIPCTQPVDASKESDDRNGRWTGLDKTECGIHFPAHYYENEEEE